MTPAMAASPGPGMREVARVAGVSAATVSRVLNDQPGVAPERRAAVLAAARALGYRTGAEGPRAREGNRRSVGVLLSRQGSPFGSTLHRAIEAELAPEGFLALVCSTHAEPERERAYAAMLLEMEPGGVIIRPSSSLALAARHAARFERAGIPVVFCETAPAGNRITSVVTDNHAGGRAAIRHLHALGHRDIAVLVKGWRRRASAGQVGFMRVEGALAEARALGIADRLRLGPDCPGERFDYGRAAMAALLAEGGRLPSAVFATTDMIGLGAIAALRDAGLDVPGDVAVLGFDGLPLAETALPSLGTMDQQIGLLGRTAARMLIARMRDTAPDPGQLALTPTLKLRESLGISRHARAGHAGA